MTPSLRKRLFQIGSFVLAALLLYLALRGVEFERIAEAVAEAHYIWLLPLVFVVLLSHWLRAWRWTMLLEGLSGRDRPVPVLPAFYSLMIGYMVNYAAPRLGEIARTGNLAQQEDLSFSAVLGTVVTERVLDVLMLLLALGSTLFIFSEHLGTLDELYLQPTLEWGSEALGSSSVLSVAGLLLAVGAALALVIWMTRTWWYSAWETHVGPLLQSFGEGLLSVLNSGRPGGLVVSTLLIWFCYALMAYLPLFMFGLVEPYGLTLIDGWGLMTLGSVGVAIPSPGGVGSYHYITVQALTQLFGVAGGSAAAYAVLTHAAQMLLYILVGGLALLVQGTPVRKVTRDEEELRAETSETGVEAST